MAAPKDTMQNDASSSPKVAQAQTDAVTGRQNACENKKESITKRSESLIKMATNMQEKFGSIESRVEKYYTDKVQPSGKTVNNYDMLVKEIELKKSAVELALTAAEKDAALFTCETKPKEQLMKFRDDMQTVKKALKEYRTSIKNLIVAVHGVTGDENKEGSESAKTMKSPKASPKGASN
jgi:hypothetical protein